MSNTLDFNLNIENNNSQTKFIESSIGKCVSTALDVGISYIFPDFIEDQVISLKNNILENGLSSSLKDAFNVLKNCVTTTKSMFSGKLNSVEEYDLALSDTGILETLSNAIKEGIYTAYKSGKLSYSNYVKINKYKNVIIDGFKSNLKQSNKNLKNLESNANYLIKEFDNAFLAQDIEKIKEANSKLSDIYSGLLPTKNLIEKIENVKNKYELLENKNFSFEISDNELELVENISSNNNI